jgi:hypothetical protein
MLERRKLHSPRCSFETGPERRRRDRGWLYINLSGTALLRNRKVQRGSRFSAGRLEMHRETVLVGRALLRDGTGQALLQLAASAL